MTILVCTAIIKLRGPHPAPQHVARGAALLHAERARLDHVEPAVLVQDRALAEQLLAVVALRKVARALLRRARAGSVWEGRCHGGKETEHRPPTIPASL